MEHNMATLHRNRTVDLGIPNSDGSTLIEETHHFTPHKIRRDLMASLFVNVPDSLKDIAKHMISEDWKIYVVDQTRGRCYYGAKTITIPAWLFSLHHSHRAQNYPLGYKIWYISHELAHAYTASDSHGPLFMARLIDTCPPEYVHFELGYKPRSATAAGIVKPSQLTKQNLGF
jgi:hypothetical protein